MAELPDFPHTGRHQVPEPATYEITLEPLDKGDSPDSPGPLPPGGAMDMPGPTQRWPYEGSD